MTFEDAKSYVAEHGGRIKFVGYYNQQKDYQVQQPEFDATRRKVKAPVERAELDIYADYRR